MRLALPEPGMPGQPMFFVIPKNAPNPELSRKFIEYVTSPKIQANEIVIRFIGTLASMGLRSKARFLKKSSTRFTAM
jgi:spermidine/putrescine-binding protein